MEVASFSNEKRMTDGTNAGARKDDGHHAECKEIRQETGRVLLNPDGVGFYRTSEIVKNSDTMPIKTNLGPSLLVSFFRSPVFP